MAHMHRTALSPRSKLSRFALPAMAATLLLLGAGPSEAAVIYETGFESGTLGPEWSTFSEKEGGRVLPSQAIFGGPNGNALPHSGDWFLGMDFTTGGSYQTNEAWLSLDLSGLSNVLLDFWWADWNDETHSQDGVYISDDGGASFTKIQALKGSDYEDLAWRNFVLDLSALADDNSLTLNSDFVIKFQQRDNFYFNGGNDGFLIDDVMVSANSSEVPEPATVWLLLSGGALMLFRKRIR